ncbi:MAG: hypothetical protein M3Z33_03305 [Actinomycetota bacterium]|nr:hypothetical protein [Actinomycetota bacterium]
MTAIASRQGFALLLVAGVLTVHELRFMAGFGAQAKHVAAEQGHINSSCCRVSRVGLVGLMARVLDDRAAAPSMAADRRSRPAIVGRIDEEALSARGRASLRSIRLVAALSLVAGVIHAVAMVQHFDEGLLYGSFFAVVAACQLAWGGWVYRRSTTRRSLVLAAVANIAVAGVWVVSRTVGVPLGPEAGLPEAPGLIDLIATLDEMAIAGSVLAITHPAGRLGSWLGGLTTQQEKRIGVALITATLFGLLLAGHAH